MFYLETPEMSSTWKVAFIAGSSKPIDNDYYYHDYDYHKLIMMFIETWKGSSCVSGFELGGGEVGFLPGAGLGVGAPVEAGQLVVQVSREENIQQKTGGGRRLVSNSLKVNFGFNEIVLKTFARWTI